MIDDIFQIDNSLIQKKLLGIGIKNYNFEELYLLIDSTGLNSRHKNKLEGEIWQVFTTIKKIKTKNVKAIADLQQNHTLSMFGYVIEKYLDLTEKSDNKTPALDQIRIIQSYEKLLKMLRYIHSCIRNKYKGRLLENQSFGRVIPENFVKSTYNKARDKTYFNLTFFSHPRIEMTMRNRGTFFVGQLEGRNVNDTSEIYINAEKLYNKLIPLVFLKQFFPEKTKDLTLGNNKMFRIGFEDSFD